jgi:hypothetical protein
MQPAAARSDRINVRVARDPSGTTRLNHSTLRGQSLTTFEERPTGHLVIGRRTSGKAHSGNTRRGSINDGAGGLNARNATLAVFRAASVPSLSDSKRESHRNHSGGRNHRPAAISDRKARIALSDLLAQQRPLTRFPE